MNRPWSLWPVSPQGELAAPAIPRDEQAKVVAWCRRCCSAAGAGDFVIKRAVRRFSVVVGAGMRRLHVRVRIAGAKWLVGRYVRRVSRLFQPASATDRSSEVVSRVLAGLVMRAVGDGIYDSSACDQPHLAPARPPGPTNRAREERCDPCECMLACREMENGLRIPNRSLAIR